MEIGKILENPKKYGNLITIHELEQLLSNAQYAYHSLGKPIMSDTEYDEFFDILVERSPESKIIDQIGAEIEEKDKIKLPYHLGSMDKVKPDSNKLDRWIKKYKGPYVISDKEDGVSCLLTYEKDSNEIKLYTRGNSTYGQDISYLKKYIKLPDFKKQKLLDSGITYAIRGELVMSKKNFESFVRKNEDSKNGYTNARNMISGIVNSKTIDKEAKSILSKTDFVTYELINPRQKISDQLSFIKKIGLITVPYSIKKELTKDELIELLIERRGDSEYEMDGLVVIDDNNHPVNESKNPKYGFAFKMDMDDQKEETVVLDVVWKPGRHGELNPRIKIKPVKIGGATINWASGYNAGKIKEKGIGPGAKVIVIRSGDVIPKILEVLEKKEPKFPDVDYYWDDNETYIYLSDINSSNVVKVKTLTNFFSKLSVSDFSGATIQNCYENGLDTIEKIISASVEDFKKLPKVQTKKATKIFESIKEGLNLATPAQLMAGSNKFGKGMGETNIQHILDVYPKILESTKSENELISEVSSIPQFAEKTAVLFVSNIKNFNKFLDKTPSLKPYLKKSQEIGEKTTSSDIFKNQVFVFSGIRPNKEMEELIVLNGGSIGNGVNKKTNVLIVKDTSKETTKIKDAKGIGIKISNMDDFKEFLEKSIKSIKKNEKLENVEEEVIKKNEKLENVEEEVIKKEKLEKVGEEVIKNEKLEKDEEEVKKNEKLEKVEEEVKKNEKLEKVEEEVKKNENNNDLTLLNSVITLDGLNVVFTGFRDKHLMKVIVSNGGIIQPQVGETTTVLITDDLESDSQKIKDAKKLNKPIVTIDTFNKKVSKLMKNHTVKKLTKKKKIIVKNNQPVIFIKKNAQKIELKDSSIYADGINKFGKLRKSKSIKAGKCIPFKYNKKLTDKCVEGKEGDWCATSVDENIKMKTWGYCNE